MTAVITKRVVSEELLDRRQVRHPNQEHVRALAESFVNTAKEAGARQEREDQPRVLVAETWDGHEVVVGHLG